MSSKSLQELGKMSDLCLFLGARVSPCAILFSFKSLYFQLNNGIEMLGVSWMRNGFMCLLNHGWTLDNVWLIVYSQLTKNRGLPGTAAALRQTHLSNALVGEERSLHTLTQA